MTSVSNHEVTDQTRVIKVVRGSARHHAMEPARGTPEPIRSSRRQLANAREGASPYSKRPPAAAGGVAPAIWEVKDEVSAVRDALKVSRDIRTEAQLAVIRKWLEGAKFNHLNMDDVRSVIPQLAQAMEFVEHPAFSPLFEQGDRQLCPRNPSPNGRACPYLLTLVLTVALALTRTR